MNALSGDVPVRDWLYRVSPYQFGQWRNVVIALPGLALLFGMLSLPAGFQSLKLALLAVLSAQIVFKAIQRQSLFIHHTIFLVFIFYISVGLLYTTHGLLNGNPGALPMAKEFVLYVAIYMVLISGVDHLRYIAYIDNVLVFSALFISLYAAATVLNMFGLFPDSLYINLYADTGMQGVQIGGGFATLDLPALPSLLFLQPYLAAKIVMNKSEASWVVWLAFLLASVAMFFVGRRALIVIAVLVPLIVTYFLSQGEVKTRSIVRRILEVNLIVGAVVFGWLIFLQGLGYDLQAYIMTFLDGFTTSVTGGGNVRLEQFSALIGAWSKNIWIGVGLGGVHHDVIRSFEQPWNYELSYVKMLFDFGLVGLLIYGVGILAIYSAAITIFRRDRPFSNWLMPIVVGNVAFLIGNTTNPYLLKLDYLSIIFLPVALINYWLLRRREILWRAPSVRKLEL